MQVRPAQSNDCEREAAAFRYPVLGLELAAMVVEGRNAQSATQGAGPRVRPALSSTEARQLGHAIAAGIVRAQLLQLFKDWLAGSRAMYAAGVDEIAWFISKKATSLINAWLGHKGMAVLHQTGPGWGVVVIPRERVEHVRNERMRKDAISLAGVEELLTALFVNGTPKYAPHSDIRRYANQLLMVDPGYKAATAGASGESPVAALQWKGHPQPHLRLETAYWAYPAKAKALGGRALKK